MKKNLFIICGGLLIICVLLFSARYLQAGETKGVNNKVILENASVKVIESEFSPGGTTDWHSHPNHVVYFLTDGKMEITDKDKQPNTIEVKAGQALYLPAVTHMARNAGANTVKMVITELKPAETKKPETPQKK